MDTLTRFYLVIAVHEQADRQQWPDGVICVFMNRSLPEKAQHESTAGEIRGILVA